MFRRLRKTATLCLAVGLLAGLPSAAAGTPTAATDGILTRHVSALAVVSQAQSSGSLSTSPAPCADGKYNIDGPRWTTTYRWYFRARSTPSYLSRRSAEATIKRGVTNITRARNDCGRADKVNARARYLGRTGVAPSCKTADGRNVVGFRSLSTGVAGRACWWMSGNRIVEADIQLNSNERWATSLVGCFDKLMLEAVMTHEAGHAFGLGHVGESRHGRLTMSTYLDGPCNNQESTLGLGDMRGLEALYP